MLRNYITTAFRNLLRNKTFSFINIFGLAVSMSICLVIIMMLADQMSFDSHVSDNDRIFRINTQRLHADEFINKFATSPLPFATEIRENYSGVDGVTAIRNGFGNKWIKFDQDLNIPISGLFAEPNFLDLFNYELQYGNISTALTDPNSVVLTKQAAEKLFDMENPVGELLKVGDLGEFKITGVIKDTGHKSHIVFEALASYSSLKNLEKDSLLVASIDNWDITTTGWVYLKLKDNNSVQDVEAYLNEKGKEVYAHDKEKNYKFSLQALSDITPGPMIANEIGPVLPHIFVYFLGGLALVIIVLSCFNYTNLSIARSLTRAKEVGIRKVAGAHRHHIFMQFISEAIIISLLSLVLAFGLLLILKPAFLNMKFAQLLRWDLNMEPTVIAICILFSIVTGFLAGALPALFLSSFTPAKVLKDLTNMKLFSRLGLRKSLVVIQFAFSLIFIISTTLIYNQLNMMVNADFGFNGENIINIRLHETSHKLLQTELGNHSSIENVTVVSHLPAIGTSYDTKVKLDPKDEAMKINYFATDDNYVNNLKLNLIAGVNFNANDIRDDYDKVIINETMVGKLALNSPHDALGQTLIFDDSIKVSIIGVLKDYNHEALMVEIGPMALIPAPKDFSMLQVRYQEGSKVEAIAHIESTWSKVNPAKKIDRIEFMHELQGFYDIMFGDLVNIIGLISFLAITIACLGLLGMAAFTTETKIKEIAIRKVLGASDKHIVFQLSRGFLILLVIAIVLAVPAAYFINSLWLESLAYRVGIDFSVLGFSIMILLLLGSLTIGSQTIKAAFTNPANSLRAQ